MKLAGMVVPLGLFWASSEAVTTISIGERERGQMKLR